MKKGGILLSGFVLMLIILTGCGKTNPKSTSKDISESTSENVTESTSLNVEEASSTVSDGREKGQTGTMISKNEDYAVYETGFEREGKHIYANLYLPNASDGKYPIVIISHGYEGSYSEMASYAEVFAKNGFAACVFDFCGGSYNSKSDGDTTDMSVLTEEKDLAAVLNGLSSNSAIDTDRIFLMGESQGGMVSALTAADNADRIKAMVLLYSALVIPDNARAQYSSTDKVPDTMDLMGMKVGKIYYADVLQMDVCQEIRGYAKDVLILHGDKDTLVPISYSERAVKEYPSASLKVIKGGGHGFYGSRQEEAAKDALDFFRDHLS